MDVVRQIHSSLVKHWFSIDRCCAVCLLREVISTIYIYVFFLVACIWQFFCLFLRVWSIYPVCTCYWRSSGVSLLFLRRMFWYEVIVLCAIYFVCAMWRVAGTLVSWSDHGTIWWARLCLLLWWSVRMSETMEWRAVAQTWDWLPVTYTTYTTCTGI